MTKKKKIGIVITAVLAATTLFCGIMFARQYSDQSFGEFYGKCYEYLSPE